MEDGGIDILAVKHMLNYAHSEDNEVSMWVSYIEIYNEVINDLLDISGTNLKVREDSTSTIGSYVEG
jgi:centromeric protein E